MTDPRTSADVAAMRASDVADLVRQERLIVILRRVTPRARMLDLVTELAAAGARLFEITLDSPAAADDLEACRVALPALGPGRCLVGAGTIRDLDQLAAARHAGASFGVSPVLDRVVLESALNDGLAFMPGAYTPTEVDLAWRSGATFVKLFPASSLGPSHIRELRGPLPEIETVATGGVDAANARSYLDAGAVAVGVGSAILKASADERRTLVSAIRGTSMTAGSARKAQEA